MGKISLFNKGNVILTNPEKGFYGIAIVLSQTEKTKQAYAQCHIAITSLMFQKEVTFSELNPKDFVPLVFEREYTFEREKRKKEPFSKKEICIYVYTRHNIDNLKIIGDIDPEMVYKGDLPFEPLDGLPVTFPVCGHPEKFWLGREAYINWERKNKI